MLTKGHKPSQPDLPDIVCQIGSTTASYPSALDRTPPPAPPSAGYTRHGNLRHSCTVDLGPFKRVRISGQ